MGYALAAHFLIVRCLARGGFNKRRLRSIMAAWPDGWFRLGRNIGIQTARFKADIGIGGSISEMWQSSLPQHSSTFCGTTVMCLWVRVWMRNLIAIWRHKQPLTTRSISALTGDSKAKQAIQTHRRGTPESRVWRARCTPKALSQTAIFGGEPAKKGMAVCKVGGG